MMSSHSLVIDWAEKLQARANLPLGIVCLNDSADNSNVNVLRADVMSRRHAGDVDICTFIRDGMEQFVAENTDRSFLRLGSEG